MDEVGVCVMVRSIHLEEMRRVYVRTPYQSNGCTGHDCECDEIRGDEFDVVQLRHMPNIKISRKEMCGLPRVAPNAVRSEV
jgi:hypothetical protein